MTATDTPTRTSLGSDYTETAIGPLPADWNVRRLGDLVALKTGPFGSLLHKSDYVRDGVPLVNPIHMSDGRILPDASTTVTEEAADRLTDFRLREGDVVVARRGEMGRSAIVRAEQDGWVCGTGSMILRSREELDPIFLQRVFSSPAIVSRITDASVGSTMVSLNNSTLSGLLIQVPSHPEQRAIAAALSDVDELIGALDKLIAKKRAIKLATMQQLLTGKTRLPGFERSETRTTEVGEIPADWRVTEIGDIASVKTGPFGSSLHESDYVEDGTPIITVEHLGDRGVVHENLPLVSDEDKRRLNAYLLEEGDIVFSRVGSVDRNARISEKEHGWLFSGRLLRLRCSKGNVNSSFLSYQFHSEPFKQRVRAVAVGQTMASLNTQILRGVLVVVPTPDEQVEIAEILFAMDAEIAALEQRRDKTKAIKQGMMQSLLTGRVRLMNPDMEGE